MTNSQTILIKGASSGFGALSARTLARQGHVVFAGIRAPAGRNAAATQALAETGRQERLALHTLELDVTDDQSVERAIRQALEMAGHLDVVVNNAGTMYLGPLEAFTPDEARRQFETNVIGALRLNRAVLPHLRARGSGLLIMIGSVLGRLALPSSVCWLRAP